MISDKFDSFIDRLPVALVALASTTLVSTVLWAFVSTLRADGKADFCYVTSQTFNNPTAPEITVYNLWTHRPWRDDRIVAQSMASFDDARSKAESIGCPIK